MKAKRNPANSRKKWLGLILLIGVALILINGIAFVTIFSNLQQHYNYQTITSEPVVTFPEIVSILGSDWNSWGIRHNLPLEDLKGRPHSLVARFDESIVNINDEMAFIHYAVMTYSDKASAQERYNIQDEVNFFLLDRARFRWSDSTIINDTISNANKSHAQCKQIFWDSSVQDRRCSAIILYGRYIVYVNMFPQRHNVEYIDNDLASGIFAHIDATMSKVVAER